jgi:hypothetical protein
MWGGQLKVELKELWQKFFGKLANGSKILFRVFNNKFVFFSLNFALAK